MKTLVFCTSYFDTEELYRKRYRKWVDYYLNHPFCENKDLFLIDDHSDLRYVDSDIQVVRQSKFSDFSIEKVNLLHFDERLGAESAANSKGWYRSFTKSLDIAERYGYEKIVHAESDAYFIRKRIFEYVESTNFGWTAFWCPMFGFPESSLQIICRDQFDSFWRFKSRGVQSYVGQMAETILPFTRIEAYFTGDRFGEYGGTKGGDARKPQTADMDYYCQCAPELEIKPEV